MTEVDFVSQSSLLNFKRYYSSSGFFSPVGIRRKTEPLGINWRHSFQRKIVVDEAANSLEATIAYVEGFGDDYRYFKRLNGLWVGRLDSNERLEELLDINNVRLGWKYITKDDEIELFNADGLLVSITTKNGKWLNLSYSVATTLPAVAPVPGLLTSIIDERSRSIFLTYHSNLKLKDATFPDGSVTQYNVDALERLVGVNYPDNTAKNYLYDEAANIVANGVVKNLMTGIIDESNKRFATYQYDYNGRAIAEWHGSGSTINRVSVSYINAAATNYTDAFGALRKKKFVTFNGIVKDAGEDWPCGTAGCTGTQSTSITYDANGYRDLFTDRRGVLTDSDHDARGLEIRRIDAKNTTAARITETVWHPAFRVPTERRICSANPPNTCPSTATAPNLLSKTTLTYNARGQVLTSTQVDPAAPSNTRVNTNVYCDVVNTTNCPLIGLMLSSNGPRTDVTDITTYSYRMADAADLSYRKGDVWKITNANSHVVEYLAYDGAGRALKMKDPNGVETWMGYHPRGWLTTRTVKGATLAQDATTTFAYTPFGAIERVTQPDGAFLQYGYDQAQRMTGISDNAGNSVIYTLDNAGNRTAEQTKDASGVLKRSLARQFDSLSRLRASLRAGVQSTDPDTAKTTHGFDANSNQISARDPNLDGQLATVTGTASSSGFDPLNRLIQAIQDVGGIAAKVEYGYDALDRLTSVKDPKNLNTIYAYDGLGNLSSLTSPDTGISSYLYDAAGNRTRQTDARGVRSDMTYDALNRLRKIEYTPAGSAVVNALKTVEFFYDEADSQTGCTNSFPVGRMSRFTDESGSTKLCYDRRGNVLQKTQTTSNNTLVLSMQYSAADRLIGLTYPSGTTASYGRDSQGRVTSVNINGSAFITGVTYLPFGPMSQITFQNGKTLTKSYDQNYDIDTIVSTATGGLNLDYSVDAVGNIKQVNQAGTVFNLAYDKLYRLLSVKDQNLALIEGFTYDATGNRTSRKLGSAPIDSYSYADANHRLAASGGGTRSFDANGNTLNTPLASSLVYDERNRLVFRDQRKTAAVTTKAVKPPPQGSVNDSFLYNARGERVELYYGRGNIVQMQTMIYDEAGKTLTDGSQDFVYIDSIPVAHVLAGNVYPVEADHLGSPRFIQDAAGTGTIWRWDLLANTATGSNAFGEQAPAAGSINNFNLRFPGQYFDGKGTHYNYFRDYESGTGRYVESDPIGLRGGVSTFGYVNSSPIDTIDPKGLEGVGCWTFGTCGGEGANAWPFQKPTPPPSCDCKTTYWQCVQNCRAYFGFPDRLGGIAIEAIGGAGLVAQTASTSSVIAATAGGVTGWAAVSAAAPAVGAGLWVGWNVGCLASCRLDSCNYTY